MKTNKKQFRKTRSVNRTTQKEVQQFAEFFKYYYIEDEYVCITRDFSGKIAAHLILLDKLLEEELELR